MKYAIEFRPSVMKSLQGLPKKDVLRIKKKIEELSDKLPEPNATKMKGSNAFHKIRSGDFRIIYEIHDDRVVILIVKIGHKERRLYSSSLTATE